MQSEARRPWPMEARGEKAHLADKVQLQTKSRAQPRIEIPLSFTKRKRMDSIESYPSRAHQVKKPKHATAGAVQPALEHTKGEDGYRLNSLPPAEAVAQRDDIVRKSMGSIAPNAQLAQTNLRENAPGGKDIGVKEEPKSLSSSIPSLHILPAKSESDNKASLQTSSVPLSVVTDRTNTMSKASVNVDKIRAVLEAQINLEILHKHNELRLIETELAKCQIGLEQLRRCEVIPYPGTGRPSLAVSIGTGPALASPQGYTSPAYAAPWGVVDGPYTKHYAKWLLHDPSFDAMFAQSGMGTPMTARGIRATRGSGAEPLLPAPPARHSRTSAGSRSQLSGDPSTPTTTRDPMIMKRQKDGEWVRLRCNNCHRSNFNNVQGFLNHCRIAHQTGFESHEAAAIVCGEIVQVDESQYNADPLPASRGDGHGRPSIVALAVDQPLVSPLISHPPSHRPQDRILSHPYTPDATPQQSPRGSTHVAKGSMMPHLSSLMQRRGLLTTNLDIIARENKKRVDLSIYDDSESERDAHSSKRSKAKKMKSATRHPSSGQYSLPTSGPSCARPTSQKGSRGAPAGYFDQPPAVSQFQAFPADNSSAYGIGHVLAESPVDGDVEMSLSPGTAADSNPGLVSDHEDDDDGDDAHSAHGSHIEVIDGISVEIEDASDVEREGRKRVRVVDGETPVCRRQGMDVDVDMAEGSG